MAHSAAPAVRDSSRAGAAPRRTRSYHRAFAALLERRFQTLSDLIGRVLRGRDPEAIHDMRVASRRLQEALAIAASATRQQSPPVIRQLRRLRKALGSVRDLDVQLALLREIASQLPRPERPRVRVLRQLLGSRRGRQVGKMRGKLGKVDLPQLVASLQAEVERLGRIPAPVLERTLRRHTGRRRSELARASIRARSTWEETDLHAARICGKRLRYALELGEALEPGSQAEAIAALKKLQNVLGEWHDLVVLDQTLMDNIGQPKILRDRLEVARTALDLIARLREKKREKVEAFCAAAGPGRGGAGRH